MSYSNETIEIRRAEAETKAFKMFSRVAKKIMRLEYGKWVLTPDPSDPLRKVLLRRDIGLATVELTVHMRDYYHRGVYDEKRWDWRATLALGGLQQKTRHEDGLIRTGVKLGPRGAKKLIEYVNNSVIPHFYQAIKEETIRHDFEKQADQQWRKNVAKVAGLQVKPRDPNSYDSTPVGLLNNCPFHIKLHADGVRFDSPTLTYDQLAEMSQRMGWGK